MDDIRRPAQFAYRFQDAAGKEDGALVIVGHELVLGVIPRDLLFEVVLVVNEVHLHPRGGDGSHLDDERVIGVIDIQVHSAQADNLVQLVPALIDDAETGHEHPDFASPLVNPLGNLPAGLADGAFRKEGLNCLTYVKDAGLAHESVFRNVTGSLKYTLKWS